MVAPLLRRKLTRPALWEAAISRDRLLGRLTEALAAGRHIALVAGSGYGKTSLLADWTRERTVAWLTLDAEDADLDSFLAYMIAACEAALPGFATEAKGLLGRARDRDGAGAVLATLLADLDEQVDRPLLIVLDDYHLAASPSLDMLLGRMLKYLPEPVRLVIATRKAPDAGFTDLIAKRQLVVVGDRELAFDARELAALRPDLPPAAIAQVLESTGGWPAALEITAELLDSYLDEQVLADQPADVRAFLQRASLVETFDAAFCEQVLAEPLHRALREWLEAHRLLWVLADGRFQVPQPWRGMLRRRFLAEAPRAERLALIEEVVAYLCRGGQAATAVHFWIEAGEPARAAELLAADADAWLEADRVEALAGALAALGPHADRPALQAARGEVARRWGDLARADEHFERAAALYEQAGDRAGVARLAIRQALTAASRGQAERARGFLALAGPQLGGGGRMDIDAAVVEGGMHLLMGEPAAAIASFEASLQLARRLGDGYAAARAIHNLGVCHTRLGDFQKALACYDQALRAARPDGTPAVWLTPVNRSLVLIYLGRHAEALAGAEEALALVRRFGLAREEGYALRTLGLAHQRLGRPEQAAGCYEAAEALARRNDDPLGRAYSLNFQADLALDQGDPARARELVALVRDCVGGDEAVARVPEFAEVRARAAGAPPAEPVPVPAPRAGEHAELRIWCFGGLRVVRQGRDVGEREWQSARAKWLLGFLLHATDGATKDRLLDAIYPSEDATDASMGMTLMRLRKALEPGLEKGQPSRYVLRVDGRYRFNLEGDFDLDTRLFERTLAAARRASGKDEVTLLEQALALYVGEFLPDLELAWAIALRDRYRDQALAACRRLVELAGTDAVALGWVQRALAIDPLSEEFNRELILRYIEADEPRRAVAHYELCARRYQDQLGLAPPKDLAALVAALR